MDEVQHCEPAASLIKRLGGIGKVAEKVGRSPVQVHRWRVPRERGGTGGAIPHWHIQALIEMASEKNIPLELQDFVSVKREVA